MSKLNAMKALALAGALLWGSQQALAAGTPISGFPSATTPLGGSEITVCNQGGVTKQCTTQSIANLVAGGSGCTVGGTVGQIVYNNGTAGCSSSAATITSGGSVTAPSGQTITAPNFNITAYGSSYNINGISWTGTTPDHLDVYLGWNAARTGYASNTGGENIAIGFTTSNSLGTGDSQNVCIGGGTCTDMAGTAVSNVALGHHAMRFNTASSTSSNNVAIGESAMSGPSDQNMGSDNVGIGTNALNNNTASNNVAVGSGALQGVTSGTDEVAVGEHAIGSSSGLVTTGSFNTAVGQGALQFDTSGQINVAVGLTAENSNTTGSNNNSVGAQSCYANVSSGNNNCFGYKAGFNSTGAGETLIGDSAGLTNTTGSNNTDIGNAADESSAALSGATAIGYNAKVGTSNTTVIGGAANTLVTLTGAAASPKVQTTTIFSAAGTALPTCNSGAEGTHAAVSDATSPTFQHTYTSGGSVHEAVYCNGTNWLDQ